MIESWTSYRLKDLGKWNGGGTPSKANALFWGGDIPWVSPKDMHARVISDSEDKITNEAVSGSSTKMCPAGSLLFVTRSGILQKRLPVAITNRAVAINQDLKALVVDNGFNASYLLNLFEFTNQRILSQCAKDGTTVESIDTNNLLDFKVSLPPLAEQERIVEILSDADAAIASAERMVQAHADKAKAITSALLLKIRENSEGEAPLSHLCRIATGRKDVNEGNPQGQYPFFTCSKEHTFSDTFSFDTEAILLAGNGDIGNPKYYSGKFEAYQRTYVLSEFEDISPIFLTEFLDYRLKRIIARERQDSAMSYIKMTTLTSIKVPVISDELQEYCVRVFSALSEERKHTEALATTLKKQKRGLMQQLLTGKLRVPEKV